MAALQYVHIEGYSALILRRDFARLSLPGAIMDRAKQWLHGTAARWNAQDKRFSFPSGASLQFGYIDSVDDRFRYASSEFQFIGFDELTEFALRDDESNPYTFLFSRLRKPETMNVPLRVRAASNPGNIGHAWVKKRFLTDEAATAVSRGVSGVFEGPEGRQFVPAAIRDNPALNAEQYEANLAHLPPVTRARLMQGDWQVTETKIICSEWLQRYETRGDILVMPDGRTIDRRECRRFATIDTAGTSRDKEETRRGRSPSYSVVAIWDYSHKHDLLFLRHVWRGQVEWPQLKAATIATLRDWHCQHIRLENAHCGPALRHELAGAGNVQLVGPVLPGMGDTGQGAKLDRAIASGLMNRLERGGLIIPQAANWLPSYEAELTSWQGLPDETSDQIDVSSYAAYECRKTSGTYQHVFAGGLKR